MSIIPEDRKWSKTPTHCNHCIFHTIQPHIVEHYPALPNISEPPSLFFENEVWTNGRVFTGLVLHPTPIGSKSVLSIPVSLSVYYILWYYIILYYTKLYYIILFYIILYYFILLYYVVLNYTRLFYIILCNIILYYIILY